MPSSQTEETAAQKYFDFAQMVTDLHDPLSAWIAPPIKSIDMLKNIAFIEDQACRLA